MLVREAKAAEAFKYAEEMKEKVQESYKEFVVMNQTMDRLRKEAARGTDVFL